MLQIKYKTIHTEFVHPFTTAHGQKTHQPALLIAITFNGVTGFGEAPAIHYYDVTVEGMIEVLLSKIEILQRYSFTEPDRFWHFCHHLYEGHSFLICALDIAYWDLYAKMKRSKMADLFPADFLAIQSAGPLPPTDYTIGIDHIDQMLEVMQQHPMPVYKIKVGSAEDADKLRTIRQHTDAVIRIDANAAWTLDQAMELLPLLETCHIELIEQPFAKDHFADTQVLAGKTDIPVIADESCVSEHDVTKCAGIFDGINIKLTKCGGITPAIRMIMEARRLNLKVMMGCMCEAETGTYAMAQFLPWVDYADMDGPLLLKTPPLQRISYEGATITIR